MTSTGTPTAITDVRTVAIPVSDQERARAFYVDLVGFQLRLDVPFGDGRWLEVAPPGATTSIALVSDATGGVDTGIRFATPDADADHAVLRAAGVDTGPGVLRYPGVPPMFSFRDPDGNRLYVVESSATA